MWLYVRRTGFAGDKGIRARTTGQFIVPEPADQDVIAVAANQKVAPATAGSEFLPSAQRFGVFPSIVIIMDAVLWR